MFSGIWVKFKMGMLCHLLWLIFWVLPMHSGKRAEEDPAASSHPTQTFQSVAFYSSDPSTTGFKSPHAHSAGAISSRWAAAACNPAQSCRKGKGHFRGQYREAVTSGLTTETYWVFFSAASRQCTPPSLLYFPLGDPGVFISSQ